MSAHESPRTDSAEWELVTAELTAAMHAETPAEPLPAAFADRITRAGESMVQATSLPMARPRNHWQWTGWLAAAAALIIALVLPRTTSDAPPDVQGARAALLANATDVQRLDWTATTDPAAHGAGGDVVWSAAAQSGVMRLVGLLPNDRARWQYQLWIFDKRRDERYPVDGGVFDVPAGSGEILVPIDARLPVGEAMLFAITVEAAGGVVVSTRERIALLAKSGG